MYSHIEISKEILNHNAIEMNIQNLFIFLFIYSLLDTLLVLYIVFKSKTIVYGLIEIMIAVVMSTVSLLTIEYNKAVVKKIIAVLKIRAVEEGEVIHSVEVDQVHQKKRISAVIATAKSLEHMYPLTFRYRYPISHWIKQVPCFKFKNTTSPVASNSTFVF